MENKLFKIYVFFQVFLIISCSAQDLKSNKSCEEILKNGLDTVAILDTLISYKIVEFYKSSIVNSTEQPIYEMTVILPNHDSESDEIEIENILKALPILPGKYNVLVCKTCSSLNTYYQAMKWLPEQKKRFKEEFIGSFKIKI